MLIVGTHCLHPTPEGPDHIPFNQAEWADVYVSTMALQAGWQQQDQHPRQHADPSKRCQCYLSHALHGGIQDGADGACQWRSCRELYACSVLDCRETPPSLQNPSSRSHLVRSRSYGLRNSAFNHLNVNPALNLQVVVANCIIGERGCVCGVCVSKQWFSTTACISSSSSMHRSLQAFVCLRQYFAACKSLQIR